MIRRIALLLLAVSGALCAAVSEESITHAGAKFRVVRVNPGQVQVVWKKPDGVPYRTFDQVQAAFAKRGETVKFIMNAGIFEPGGIPSGLHIEKRKTLHDLNLADAPGNFFLKPNGVVWIETGDKATASIGTPTRFSVREKQLHAMSGRWLETAVQSGPLLLIKGKRHPAFTENSASKLHRNGVGVDDQGRMVFAMTGKGQAVNFWDFAGLFLKLGCQDALFLDGEISQMAVNPDKPVQRNQFGAMFVVAE